MMQYKMVLELFQKLHPLNYASQFVHDIIDYPSFIEYEYWIWEVQKERGEITTIWISQEKKAFIWNKKFFIVFEGLSLVKKQIIVDKNFNKASSLSKMFEGLLIEKLLFCKVKWTISLKILELRLWLYKRV